jgi:PBP1b-binding outer membrane lipoprotein LpoB
MRILLLALLLAACSDSPAGNDERDPGFPEDQPFDSVQTNCVPGETVVNGQVVFVCPGAP